MIYRFYFFFFFFFLCNGSLFFFCFFLGGMASRYTEHSRCLRHSRDISSWSSDEMDWALLQKTGTINPSLNMNLNELILGILVLMYVLNEVIIQRIKVMVLRKCSKTQWLRQVG